MPPKSYTFKRIDPDRPKPSQRRSARLNRRGRESVGHQRPSADVPVPFSSAADDPYGLGEGDIRGDDADADAERGYGAPTKARKPVQADARVDGDRIDFRSDDTILSDPTGSAVLDATTLFSNQPPWLPKLTSAEQRTLLTWIQAKEMELGNMTKDPVYIFCSMLAGATDSKIESVLDFDVSRRQGTPIDLELASSDFVRLVESERSELTTKIIKLSEKIDKTKAKELFKAQIRKWIELQINLWDDAVVTDADKIEESDRRKFENIVRRYPTLLAEIIVEDPNVYQDLTSIRRRGETLSTRRALEEQVREELGSDDRIDQFIFFPMKDVTTGTLRRSTETSPAYNKYYLATEDDIRKDTIEYRKLVDKQLRLRDLEDFQASLTPTASVKRIWANVQWIQRPEVLKVATIKENALNAINGVMATLQTRCSGCANLNDINPIIKVEDPNLRYRLVQLAASFVTETRFFNPSRSYLDSTPIRLGHRREPLIRYLANRVAFDNNKLFFVTEHLGVNPGVISALANY